MLGFGRRDVRKSPVRDDMRFRAAMISPPETYPRHRGGCHGIGGNEH